MRTVNTLELCHQHLFSSLEEMQEKRLAMQMIERIKRIRSVYTLWNNAPLKLEKEIRDYIMQAFNISRSEAYEDIKIIKQLLGDFNEASKSWHRFRFNAMIEKAYRQADIKNNTVAMSLAAKEYAKYNKLDKDEAERLPFDQIAIQPFYPTLDPSELGIEPVPNIKEKIRALKDKYFSEIEDVNYEEAGIDPALLNF